jgi:hypothetical protein
MFSACTVAILAVSPSVVAAIAGEALQCTTADDILIAQLHFLAVQPSLVSGYCIQTVYASSINMPATPRQHLHLPSTKTTVNQCVPETL